MASITCLLSVLLLVAGTQSAAVPSAMNPLSVNGANGGLAAGMGMAGDAMAMGNSAMQSGMGMAGDAMAMGNSAMKAGTSTAGSITDRLLSEGRKFNGNMQNAIGAQMNGGANMFNTFMKADAAMLEELGPMIRSIAVLSGETIDQVMQMMREVMTGGPLKMADFIQKTLTYMAKKKREAGNAVVSKTSSFAEGMKKTSMMPFDMLGNFRNSLAQANDYTAAMTGRLPFAGSAANAAAALTPPVA